VRPYFQDSVDTIPADGVNIHGLYLEGAQWSMKTSNIEDSAPGEAITKFPVIWLEPVDASDNIEGGCYACPLYKTSTRRGELSTTGHSTNFVLFLYIPTENQPDYWLRRGAALLAMTDD
jgi:dynein heavy chain